MQSYQAYLTLHLERIRPIIDEAYEEYLDTIPDDEEPVGKFKFQNEKEKEMLAAEPDEVRDEVEQFRRGAVDGPSKTKGDDEGAGMADQEEVVLKEARKAVQKQIK